MRGSIENRSSFYVVHPHCFGGARIKSLVRDADRAVNLATFMACTAEITVCYLSLFPGRLTRIQTIAILSFFLYLQCR